MSDGRQKVNQILLAKIEDTNTLAKYFGLKLK